MRVETLGVRGGDGRKNGAPDKGCALEQHDLMQHASFCFAFFFVILTFSFKSWFGKSSQSFIAPSYHFIFYSGVKLFFLSITTLCFQFECMMKLEDPIAFIVGYT